MTFPTTGSTLSSSTTYYWRIRFFDAGSPNGPGDWSATQTMTTGSLAVINPVYYSIGTDSSNLETGSGTVAISSGTATFSVAQADKVGVGDEVVAGGISYFISGRTSPTVYSVTTRTGSTPSDIGATSVTSINRAFNTLAAAESGGQRFLARRQCQSGHPRESSSICRFITTVISPSPAE